MMLLHLLLLLFASPIGVLPSTQPLTQYTAPMRVSDDSVAPILESMRAVALDAQSGTILWGKGEHEIQPMASLTKLMTALVVVDTSPNWSEEIVIVPSDLRNTGTLGLHNGNRVSIEALFEGMLVGSANDAAAALARSTGFTQDEFVARMNAKAKALGLLETHFADPTGLNADNTSSAYDIANLLRAATRDEHIRAVMSLTSVKSPSGRTKLTTNELLESFLNTAPYQVIGGKTGFIDESGYCLALDLLRSSVDGGGEIITVVLGAPSIAGRLNDTKRLAHWIFTHYRW